MSKNSSAKYYQENKQRKTTKKACEKYQSLSKEEKEKKATISRERYKTLREDEKEKLV